MTNPITQLFDRLRRDHQRALMPFLTAGDPDIETSRAVLSAAIEAGADLCEVGIPYSDPIADGPVIQASYQRALDAGFRLDQAMQLGHDLTAVHKAPLVTMVSYSIIHRVGIDDYLARAVKAGYAGAIVPDLPVDEAAPLAEKCKQHSFALIQLVTPTTPRERQLKIAETTTGFLYYVSVTGITGERTKLPEGLASNVQWLRERTELPICIGFGISGVETAKQLAPVADGLIVGSAMVRRVAQSATSQEAAQAIGSFVAELKEAIQSV